MNNLGNVFRFTFFKTHDEAFHSMAARINEAGSEQNILETLGLEKFVEEDEEENYLDEFELRTNSLLLVFYHSTLTRLNHAIVRAFKDYGCEFCHVEFWDDDEGYYGDEFYLYRGRKPSPEEESRLIDLYYPEYKVEQHLQLGALSLPVALTNGLDPNTKINGNPILYSAYISRNKTAFNQLIAAGANVNALTKGDMTILNAILEESDKDSQGFIATLVENGANISTSESDENLLLWKLGNKNLALSQKLIQDGTSYSRPDDVYGDDDSTNLFTAIEHNDVKKQHEFLATLLKDKNNWHELFELCVSNDYAPGLNELINSGFDIWSYTIDDDADEPITALDWAKIDESFECFELLLDKADSEHIDYSESAEEYVYTLAHQDDTNKLLKRMVEKHPHSASYRALDVAVNVNAIQNAAVLLETGVQTDNAEGMSLLHEYLHTLTPDMFDLLVQHGCNPLDTGYEYDENKKSVESSLLERAVSEEQVRPDTKEAIISWATHSDEPGLIYIFPTLNLNDHFEKLWESMSHQEQEKIDMESLAYLSTVANNAFAVRFCLEKGIDANHKNSLRASLMELAVVANSHAVLNVLLTSNANPNTMVDMAKIMATVDSLAKKYGTESIFDDDEEVTNEEQDAAIAKLLNGLDFKGKRNAKLEQLAETITEPVSIPHQSANCVMLAAANGDVKCLALLLSANADLEHTSRENEGFKAIHYATINGHTECVELLIQAGAGVNDITIDGHSPIHFAAARGHSTILTKLLQAGANPDGRTFDEKQTALLLASVTAGALEHHETTKLLLAHGVDINATDVHRYSSLSYACAWADESLINTLLENGADVNMICTKGKTPYDVFMAHGIKPVEFNIETLKPTSKWVVLKKFRHFTIAAIKRLFISFLLLFLGAEFLSASIGITLAAVFLCWPQVPLIFAKLFQNIQNEDEFDFGDEYSEQTRETMKAGMNILINGFHAGLVDMKKDEEIDQEIIASWDDDQQKV